MNAAPLLDVGGLEVAYRVAGRAHRAVREVDLTVARGEVVAVVGESGSGKSTLAHAIVGLLPATGRVGGGRIVFDEQELTGLSERRYRAVRGREIGLVPQDPTVSLNPVKRVGVQVAEALTAHGLADRRAAGEEAVALLDRAGIPDPGARARQYPHELSGGMRQRVLIAIAIAAGPKLLIADEPTSALDATVQRRILDHLEELTARLGTAVLLVTHDLGVAADRASRLVVMSQGRVVETGPVADVLRSPNAPYTRRLIDSAPGLRATAALAGRRPASRPAVPEVHAAGVPLVEVEHLVKEFPLARGPGRDTIRAVDDVSFTIGRGETLALVGESGSGKSTAARLVLRLLDATSGRVLFDGDDVTRLHGGACRALRRRAQLVYQNPFASLDPRLSVTELVTEPLRVFGVGDRASRRRRARDLLDRVALRADVSFRRPEQLSGGQRQRVAIARALALSPDLVVCDEPVSALDASVQAQVLDLLASLQQLDGLSYLFISHDLAVVRQVAHRVGVMRDGRVVETGPTERIFDHPEDEYTGELLAAIAGRRRAA